MSGGLLYSFREGDRSELLADYLLSAIGLTTPVRRQDDHGFDFYCQIADNESGYLTFGFPFMIQIKSKGGSSTITYGEEKNWKVENISWLFRNEIPFFIGIVDKKASLIEIYDTTGLWQVYNYNSKDPSKIEIKSLTHSLAEERENCRRSPIEEWGDNKGDGFEYEIDLGNPIISLTNEDILDEKKILDRKNLLRRVVEIEQINILHRKQNVRAFTEIKNNLVNNSEFRTGAKFEARDSDDPGAIYAAVRDALIVQLFTLNLLGKQQEVDHLKVVLKHVPYTWYYRQLYESQPGNPLLDWMDPTKFV